MRTTGDPGVVAEFGIPPSTARGWLHATYQPVLTANVLERDQLELQLEVVELRRRNRRLAAVIRLLLALLSAFEIRFD